MKVLFVTRGFPPAGRWGSEGYAHDLAQGLVDLGNEVDVFFPTRGSDGLQVREVRPRLRVLELSLPVRRGKPFRDSYLDPRQDQVFSEILAAKPAYDRVHFTALGGGLSFGLLREAKKQGVQIFVTLTEYLPFCHRGQFLTGALEPCSQGPQPRLCALCLLETGPFGKKDFVSRFKRGLSRLLFPFGEAFPIASPVAFARREAFVKEALDQVDLFFLPSKVLRERYEALGLPKEKLRELPYSLSPGQYESYIPHERGEKLVLAFLGQLAPHKGPQVLVEALGRLPRHEREKLIVRIHGSQSSSYHPGFVSMLEARIKELDLPLPLRGHFPPAELSRVLSETDLLVLPSLWDENLPLVLLHAIACKIPVLASDVGGIREFLAPEQNALLAKPGDAASLAAQLARLVREPELFGQLRKGAASHELPASYEQQLRYFADR